MAAKPDSVFDGKLKETIETEAKAKKRWKRKWAAMSTREFYEEIIRQETVRFGLDPEFYFEWVRKNQDLKKITSSVHIKPSPPVPAQSSQMIGWRSMPEHTLEIAGPFFVSRKDTMTLQGREPKEEHDFIMLG
ncbi:uncharacterized protein LOC106662997 [Cimex lectularius]|uniref:Uncharacterized protein n=1 Tax=Cimex lectularius TaxID=79782 RepID=A0A8I6RBW5_CIMLE|nr:uncharacterized protein LOC106662997 [Cimex lectularius]